MQDRIYECCNKTEAEKLKQEKKSSNKNMGILYYEKLGCYECDGTDRQCSNYTSDSKLKRFIETDDL